MIVGMGGGGYSYHYYQRYIGHDRLNNTSVTDKIEEYLISEIKALQNFNSQIVRFGFYFLERRVFVSIASLQKSQSFTHSFYDF